MYVGLHNISVSDAEHSPRHELTQWETAYVLVCSKDIHFTVIKPVTIRTCHL